MDPIATLSNEVCLMIGEFCTVPDLARLAQTHRRFNDLFRPRIWKRNIHDEPYCNSCLLYAAAHKRLDIFRIALGFGADMNGGPVPVPAPGRKQAGLPWDTVIAYNTEFIAPRPLHIAAWNGDLEMVKFLLDHGALLEVSWLKCTSKFQRATQKLPAFLQPEALTRKPLPPSGIRPSFTLNEIVRDANRAALYPARIRGQRRSPFVHSSIFGLELRRDLRTMNPLEIALALPADNNVASTLIQRCSLRAHLTERGLIRSLMIGNTCMFDRLLDFHPEVDGENCVRHRILYILGEEAVYRIPLEMVRHAFLQIWMPNLPLFDEIRAFGSAHVSLIFFSIITRRYREALLHIHAVVNLHLGLELTETFLHHVWSNSVSTLASIRIDNNIIADVRLPDDDPAQTRYELTRALLRYRCEDHFLIKESHASERRVTALYLAAVGSESCPWRLEAVKLMLEAGHQQQHVVDLDFGKPFSLLQLYAEQAARDRDMLKWHRPLQICLDHQAGLGVSRQPWCSAEVGTLEYSITAWVEPDGRRPLFNYFLETAASYNIDLEYLRSLLDKHDGANEILVRDSLIELAKKLFGQDIRPDARHQLEEIVR